MKIFYIVAGANGSGKTTFATDFAKEYNLAFINADIIAKTLLDKSVGSKILGDKVEDYKIKAGKIVISKLKKKYILKNLLL